MSENPRQPDNGDDFCAVCGLTAPFIKRDRVTHEVARFCRIHVPAEFETVKPSLTRRIEEALLERWRNESSPPAAA